MSADSKEAAARRIQGAWRVHVARKEAAKNKADITKRKHASMEILTTEESYCRTLDLIVDRFLNPIREGKILSKKNVALIFANIEDIRQINCDMLGQLRHAMEGWTNQTKVGPVLAKLVHSLRLYKTYCSNYNAGLTRLEEKRENNPKFAAFLERTNTEMGVNMPLQAYLIQPVQRIPRYRLLFAELLKRTPESHVDYDGIRQSLESVAEIAILVNESIREAEYMNSLVELKKKFSSDVPDLIKPRRHLIKEGGLMKVCRKEPKPRQFFLLNDLLIYASTLIAPTTSGAQFRFHRAMPLHVTGVVDIPDRNNVRYAFQFLSKAKSFEVRAESAEEKADWIAAFNKAAAELHAAEHGGSGAGVGSPHSGGGGSGGGESSSAGSGSTGSGSTGSVSSVAGIAPVWAPDKDSKVCMLCQVKFTTLNRRHHCRNCGTLCCGVCSAHKTFLPNINKTCRVCFACFETITGRPASGAKGSKLRREGSAVTAGKRSPTVAVAAAHETSVASNVGTSPDQQHALSAASPAVAGRGNAPPLPLNAAPPLDTDDDEFSSGSEFIDSDDELWEPPSRPAPPVPSS